MLKVHILGAPGSGKTTLAEMLSTRFHIPHYNLEKIGWKHGEASFALYVEDVLALLKQPGWVTEGIFLFWTDPLLYQADCIVLCDIPWLLAIWRIIYRHFAKLLQGNNPYPDIRSLFKLLKDTRYFYDRNTSPNTFMCEYLKRYWEITKPPATGFTNEFAEEYLEKCRAITEPVTEEFVQTYQAQYKNDTNIPVMVFLRMHHKQFRDSMIPNQTLSFTHKYLERYKEKVFLVRNNIERGRLIEFLTDIDRRNPG